jgi:DNA helicase-2/ATP-dependent DNA helicase PcrA
VTEQAGAAPTVTADDIADALGRPRPTAQQRAVIEAPLAPALVVAGAGSGKTETMAGRVLWLLANQLVRPAEVLGLTFTRKAAAELNQRIRERIGALRAADLLPGEVDEFDVPVVATYNSYANTLYRDNAVRLGREADGAVLGEAAAWQLARTVILASRDERLPDLGKNLDPLTSIVLNLSRAIAENVVDRDRVQAFAADFARVAELPPGGAGRYERVDGLAESVGALDVLVDLAAEYASAKAQRGLVEYSDQVALALEIVRAVPSVVAAERERFKVVLLDEYQDTSVVQSWLLAELFGGLAVMAVGDPNQSIYGWRGASASNLVAFPRQFGAAGEAYPLSISWRNGVRILDAANELVRPSALDRGSGGQVEVLAPSPLASDRVIDLAYPETVLEEADAVAAWFARLLAVPRADGTPPSAAMLLRTRKAQAFFLEALRRHDVPFHVLGLGGLMAEPEIADLVSALRVVSEPDAGIELIRLLGGSRWRIGVQDLHALNRLASWLRDRDYAQQLYEEDLRDLFKRSLSEGEGGSIVDALDFVASASPEHGALAAFSAVGLERLRDAGALFAVLRSRAGLPLPDLVAFTVQELQLDVELVANEYRTMGRANLDALFDALDGYLQLDAQATLGGFLAWLREAELREDLSPRPEDPEPGTVQVLTIHGAKGLEWDAVAVPRMVEDELPARPLEGYQGWLSYGSLPWPFRGDAAELPRLEWEAATTRKELLDAVKLFSEGVRERSLAEERRLAYVAVTRARHALMLSGSWWATQVKPRTPSPFLVDLASAGIVAPLPEATAEEANPLGDRLEVVTWPFDPLGGRRPAVEAAAAAVRAATPQLGGQWQRELELLLAERDARLGAGLLVDLPVRVPASRFKDYLTDPAAVAASLRRPMPERPYRATQLGTLFHAWVEDRYGAGDATDELDALSTEADTEYVAVDDAELARLRGIFERSEWAGRRPVEVEREIHLPFAGRTVVCKIDAVYFSDAPPAGAKDQRSRYEIVDWKTGKAPKDAKDLEEKQLQLALYRLAFAKWKGVDPDIVDAVFYYVADDRVIRPERLFDEVELLARWSQQFQ